MQSLFSLQDPQQWVRFAKYKERNPEKRHYLDKELLVPLGHVLRFYKQGDQWVGVFNARLQGGAADDPKVGVVHQDSKEFVNALHTADEKNRNELTEAIDGLRQQLEYNPILGTAVLDARRQFEEAQRRENVERERIVGQKAKRME